MTPSGKDDSKFAITEWQVRILFLDARNGAPSETDDQVVQAKSGYEALRKAVHRRRGYGLNYGWPMVVTVEPVDRLEWADDVSG